MPRIGEGTRVWDESGLWGDHEMGANCVTGRSAPAGDGVRIGNLCKVEAFAFLPSIFKTIPGIRERCPVSRRIYTDSELC